MNDAEAINEVRKSKVDVVNLHLKVWGELFWFYRNWNKVDGDYIGVREFPCHFDGPIPPRVSHSFDLIGLLRTMLPFHILRQNCVGIQTQLSMQIYHRPKSSISFSTPGSGLSTSRTTSGQG
jgi:hypothetical protein